MTRGHTMGSVTTGRPGLPSYRAQASSHPRSEAKRSRIIEKATQHFAEHGYHAARVADIAAALGVAKGSVFQHFGSKDGLFLEVYRRAVRSFPKYLDAPAEVRQAGFFAVLRYHLLRAERLLHDDPIPYRISLLGSHATGLALRGEIKRLLLTEDPHGTEIFVRFGLERCELRKDLDLEMMVSILVWAAEGFHDTLLTAKLDYALLRRPGEFEERKEARIQQYLGMLQRAIGSGGETHRSKQRARVRGDRRR